MKILIVRMYPDVLNIRNYNCQEVGLAKAMIRQGNVCDIVLYTNEKEHEEDIFFDNDLKKIHIYYLRAKSLLKNAIFENKIYEIIKKYDVVQTAEYDQIFNINLKKILGNKLVIYHGPYESKYTKGYKIKCMISDFVYLFNKDYKNTKCISKSVLATEFLKKKGFKNITTVGVGLDDERFRNVKEPNEEVTKLIQDKKENNYKYLLYIGKLEDRRNIPFIIDILYEIIKKQCNVKLLIIGKGDKEYIDKCFDYARKKNVNKQIIYYESMKQEELPNIYNLCDCFLLPTQYEIFGMVILESMYFGLPVITTLNGGSSTLIQNKVNGYICDLNNINEWRDNIINLFNSESEYEKISSNCKNTISEKYLWNNLVEKFINRYKDIM